VTKLPETLRCPNCEAPLATHDGLGTPGAAMLNRWLEILASHRQTCQVPPPPAAR
jgi:hypothetical protein